MGEGRPQQASVQVIVDAIEGDKVRVELGSGVTADWDRGSLPADVKEGNVVVMHGEGEGQQMRVDHAETSQRRQEAQAQLDALNGRPKGEIDL